MSVGADRHSFRRTSLHWFDKLLQISAWIRSYSQNSALIRITPSADQMAAHHIKAGPAAVSFVSQITGR